MRGSTTKRGSSDSRSNASDSKPDRRLRYGGAWFSAASALPLNGRLSRPRLLARLTTAVIRRPRGVVALVALLLRAPREYVVLTGSRAGRALDRHLNQRRFGILKNRLFRGVLLLPEDHADYLRGRRRHALRTNLRRAATAGIRCDVLSDSRRVRDEVSVVVRSRWDDLPEAELSAWVDLFCARVAGPEMTVIVARDQDGSAVAALAATIDDSVCGISFAVSTCREARWALHDHLVRLLIARRVRYLLAADEGLFGALGYPSAVQHYQHLLGYELRHVIPSSARPRVRRRRLVASAAVAAAATMSIIVPRAAGSTLMHTSLQPVVRTPAASSARIPGASAPRGARIRMP